MPPRATAVPEDSNDYETYLCLEGEECVEKSCRPESEYPPGSYPDFPLTYTFFEKKVLTRYCESNLYEVTNRLIRCSNLWSLKLWDDGDLINVLLTDLGLIPSDEQRHWKRHNVPPRHSRAKSASD